MEAIPSGGTFAGLAALLVLLMLGAALVGAYPITLGDFMATLGRWLTGVHVVAGRRHSVLGFYRWACHRRARLRHRICGARARTDPGAGLAGVVVGSLAGAAISLLKILADPYDQLPAIVF
jgi:ABC-type Fe3+-siderophore transport system permease subunit